jgi:hypothetical protein
MLRSNALWTGPKPDTFECDLFTLDQAKRNEHAEDNSQLSKGMARKGRFPASFEIGSGIGGLIGTLMCPIWQ